MEYIKVENDIYGVLKTEHNKMGRGQGVDRYFLKNLSTGTVIERTFKGNQEAENVNLERKAVQFLYADSETYNFMDNNSFEQFELGEKIIGKAKNYIREGDTIDAILYNDKILTIELPGKVKLKVTSAEPATKGNSVDSPTKTIELETGLRVAAPLFIKSGDNVIINTESGKYIERAK